MLKRVIFIIVMVLIGAYFVNSYFEKRAKEEAEKAEAKRIENDSSNHEGQVSSDHLATYQLWKLLLR